MLAVCLRLPYPHLAVNRPHLSTSVYDLGAFTLVPLLVIATLEFATPCVLEFCHGLRESVARTRGVKVSIVFAVLAFFSHIAGVGIEPTLVAYETTVLPLDYPTMYSAGHCSLGDATHLLATIDAACALTLLVYSPPILPPRGPDPRRLVGVPCSRAALSRIGLDGMYRLLGNPVGAGEPMEAPGVEPGSRWCDIRLASSRSQCAPCGIHITIFRRLHQVGALCLMCPIPGQAGMAHR